MSFNWTHVPPVISLCPPVACGLLKLSTQFRLSELSRALILPAQLQFMLETAVRSDISL
jgi:hypothetical protein